MMQACNTVCFGARHQTVHVLPLSGLYTPVRAVTAPWRRSKAAAQPTGVLPAEHPTSPFHELDLEDLWSGIGKVRVRQHVNPLRREHQIPTTSIDWAAAFSDPTRPLVLDLGCGPGRFLMLLHKRRTSPAPSSLWSSDRLPGAAQGSTGEAPQYNYLGLEIRRPLVERANEWAQRLGCSSQVHYIYCNATISLGAMMSTYPGPVDSVFIQFPDPHFKKRHHKRRIFQPQLVNAIKDVLPPGGKLFLQSDVESVSIAMRNIFEKYAGDAFGLAPEHQPEHVFFSAPSSTTADADASTATTEQTASPAPPSLLTQHDVQPSGEMSVSMSSGDESEGMAESSDSGSDDDDYETMQSEWAAGGWLRHNPLAVPTEREHYVEQQGLPVYRVLLTRR